jgi:hypothetical protein
MMAVPYGAEHEKINGEHRREKCGVRQLERAMTA